jgi:formate hydrogenlyase transcriptional activator
LAASHTDKLKLSFLLFDKIEKASDSLWQLLLGMLDKVTLTLGDNRRVDLSQTVIFLTSNLGGGEITELLEGGMGFIQPKDKPAAGLDAKVERTAVEAARRKFSPEFMNRLDTMVVFHPLNRDELDEVLEIELRQVQKRVSDSTARPFLFRITGEGREFLLQEGTDQRYGARHRALCGLPACEAAGHGASALGCKAQQIEGGTNMAWGNAILSENQNDVEPRVTEQGYEAEIPTCATAEATSSALFSIVASRGSQAMNGKTAKDGFEGIVGASGSLREVLNLVRTVAATDSTTLIEGETGTGKELIARAIHNISPRSGHPFVRLNCAAIPFDLLESELFGHEKGAFTGAFAQKIGRFEMADKGTLFLDEIGDIPLALQPKLLRVLQEQEFERLGGGRTHRINVRVVAATHRDLAKMVRRNEFRSDLYYRLNVFPVVLPPLRERQQDISQLVSHFVEVFGGKMGKRITCIPNETLSALIAYPWPGNVRELQNLIERAVILSNNGVLPNPLPTSDKNALTNPLPVSDKNPLTVTPSQGTFNDSTRALILQALREAGWVIGGPHGAAARLGLKRTTLIAKMKKLGISRLVRRRDMTRRPVPGTPVELAMAATNI